MQREREAAEKKRQEEAARELRARQEAEVR